MKVLYFHQHFTTPALGGGTRSYEFAKKLIERGHSVTMVCGGRASLNLNSINDSIVSRGNVDGIDVIQINIPYSNSLSLFKRAVSFVRFALKGISIAKSEEYDLLFATSTPLTAGIPGIWSKLFRRNQLKFVFEVRDLWPELPRALGLRNPLLLSGMSILEKLSYKYADGCIGLSPGICEGIKKRVSKVNTPIVLIPNGCDLNLFTPQKKKHNINLEGITSDDSVAVFTGAHGIANGLDSVLDMAYSLLKKGRGDIKLVFIGSGKMKNHLVKRVETENLSNCLFFSPMSKIELSEKIASADVGLMVLKNIPAFYFGTSPNKFFDYISSGLPVLNNYPGWLADMIEQYNCGKVVEPNNADLFADELIKMVDNKSKLKEYSINCRKLAETNFDRNKLADQFVDFLEEIYAI